MPLIALNGATNVGSDALYRVTPECRNGHKEPQQIKSSVVRGYNDEPGFLQDRTDVMHPSCMCSNTVHKNDYARWSRARERSCRRGSLRLSVFHFHSLRSHSGTSRAEERDIWCGRRMLETDCVQGIVLSHVATSQFDSTLICRDSASSRPSGREPPADAVGRSSSTQGRERS